MSDAPASVEPQTFAVQPNTPTPWIVKPILYVLDRYGIPTLFLGIISYGIWSAGTWVGNEVLVPFVRRQIELINTLDGAVEEIKENSAAQANAMMMISAQMQEQSRLVSENGEKLEDIAEALKK